MKRLPRRDHVKPDEASRIAWTVIRSSCKFRSNAESVLGYCNDPVPEFRVVECLFFCKRDVVTGDAYFDRRDEAV